VNEFVRRESEKRCDLHKGHESQRVLSPDYNYVGMLGEWEFGKLVGLFPDFSEKPGGDNGADFTIKLSFTVDVKTARRAYNLIHEQGKPFADIYVLAEYKDDDDSIMLIGWEWGYCLRNAPTKDFGYGVINHYISREKLRDINELMERMI